MGLIAPPQACRVIPFLLITTMLCPLARGGIIYVDAAAPGDGNGSSWAEAYNQIQNGIDAALDGDTVAVAPGEYIITEPITFRDKAITVRSEEGPNETTIRMSKALMDWNTEYALVLFDNGEDFRSLLEGFTLTESPANGVLCVGSAPRLQNCVMTANTSRGVWCLAGSSPTIADCTIIGNSDGGVKCEDSSSPTITRCVLSGNRGDGGVFCVGYCSPTITNCRILRNENHLGAGVRCEDSSSPKITNCLISGNLAPTAGGGVFVGYSSATITNCTISGNSAGEGDGVYCENASLVLTNCIVWDNVGEAFSTDGASDVQVAFSCVEGDEVWPGVGNINVAPGFVNPVNADYRLQVGSPCIDAGDNAALPRSRNTVDLDGNPRIANSIVDMGAYEGSVAPRANVYYVDADAAGANDGTSWADAFVCLQDALANAYSAEKPMEVHIAQGIYKPDQHLASSRPGNQFVASGDRAAAFQLINGVVIKGGYAGFGEPDPNARDTELYTTTLSGDLSGDDGPDFAHNSENSRNVVTGSDTNEKAVLDGVTITAGNNDGTPQRGEGWSAGGWGGGMYNSGGSPTITNCIFSANSARYGGGMLNDMGSCPTLTNCIFSENVVTYDGGGGMYNRANSTPFLADCVFTANSARWGGAMYNGDGNCVQMINCTFAGNSAEEGGGIHNNKGSDVVVVNCTFAANEAGAIVCAGARPTVVNSILWGNGPDEINLWNASIDVTYCDVEGGWPGVGNVDADPLFADPDSGDYHLKSRAGRWDPVSESWVTDDVTSPCIDVGSPSRFAANEPEPNGSRVNMGAYGGTAEASKSE